MNRVIFLNRFFFPDHSATSQILSDLAFHLAASGIETHVIASQQLYDEPNARLPAEETVREVHIHRVATTHFGRSALLGRGIDYFSYYYSTDRLLLSLAKRDDIVVAMTDPPLISLIATRAARRRNAHLVNWLQDIYPEVAIQLKVPFLNGPIGRILAALRDQSLKVAKSNVVVGRRMATQILSHNIAPDRVHVIPNWTDDHEILPLPHADNLLRQEWALQDKFVVGYSGNLGRAHEFATVLAASQRLKNHPHIVFVCIGGGRGFDDLCRCVQQQGVADSFRFFPYQSRDMLKYSLSVADVHWISINPRIEALLVPSKFYGIAAAGRPTIAISPKDGEIAQLIEQHGCGIVIEPGDADALAQTLLDLSQNAERVRQMGRCARELLETYFTRQQGFTRWRAMLQLEPPDAPGRIDSTVFA